jgi:beta-N-acetylhexosaminidase
MMSAIGSMSLDEKIGQLFMIGINGTEISEDAVEMVEKYHAGGVILFARNISGGAQVRKLTSDLKARAKYPLAVAIDQEGGLVLRLTEGATVLGGNMALAACGGGTDENYCRRWGKITAEELLQLGFTLNLAPVLDVNNIKNPGIGARSFSDDPLLCSRLGAALIDSMQANGLSACAKHFPGKGNASLDAHIDLPVIDSTLDELRGFDLVPFKRAIEAGVDAVMTAHVIYRGIEGESLPATLSYKVLSGLLKDELGFSGPLITDDMEMGAIKNYYKQHEACFKSFMAGADIILICHTKELQIETINYFKEKFISGELSPERLEDALERIFKMKSRGAGREIKSLSSGDYENNAKFAQQLSDSSITLVSDGGDILGKLRRGGLDLKRMAKVFIVEAKFSAITQVEDVEETSALAGLIKKELADSPAEVINEKFDVKITSSRAAEIYKDLEEKGIHGAFVVLLTYNAHIFEGQRALAALISENAAYTVAAAVRNPYDLIAVNDKACKIATYGFRRSNMLSLHKVICAKLEPAGVLPVKL